MKIAMINVYNRIKKEKLKTKIVLQIHDELLLESPILIKGQFHILLNTYKYTLHIALYICFLILYFQFNIL